MGYAQTKESTNKQAVADKRRHVVMAWKHGQISACLRTRSNYYDEEAEGGTKTRTSDLSVFYFIYFQIKKGKIIII